MPRDKWELCNNTFLRPYFPYDFVSMTYFALISNIELFILGWSDLRSQSNKIIKAKVCLFVDIGLDFRNLPLHYFSLHISCTREYVSWIIYFNLLSKFGRNNVFVCSGNGSGSSTHIQSSYILMFSSSYFLFFLDFCSLFFGFSHARNNHCDYIDKGNRGQYLL